MLPMSATGFTVTATVCSCFERLLTNPWICHPEESETVLSATKEGSLQFVEITIAEILLFAQNDIWRAFCSRTAKAPPGL